MALVMSSPCLGSRPSPSMHARDMRSPLRMPKSTPKLTPSMPVLSEDSRVLVDVDFRLESAAVDSIKKQCPPPSPLWPATPPSLSQLVMRNTFLDFASPILDASQVKRDRALSDFTGLQFIKQGLVEEDWSLPPAACDTDYGAFDARGHSGEWCPDANYMQWNGSECGYTCPQQEVMWVPVQIRYDTVPFDQYMPDSSFSGTYQHDKVRGIFGTLSEAHRRCNSALWS